jgi:hypothetical protein
VLRQAIDPGTVSAKNVEMLPLLFGLTIFAFLLLGAVVFVVCAVVPPIRRYALSAALWCAVCGPCTIGWMTLAGLGLAAAAFITKNGDLQSFHSPRLIEGFGWTYLIVGVIATAAVATGIAWLHQKVVRRFTFALFRLYVTAVSAGIGCVFGLFLGWLLMWREVAYYGLIWCVGVVILVVGFAFAAYRNARRLRGEAPTRFTWISPEEYMGVDSQ